MRNPPPEWRDAILAAFEEGYVQGAHHKQGRSILSEAQRIGRAFLARVESTARERNLVERP